MNLAQKEKENNKRIMKMIFFYSLSILSFIFLLKQISYPNLIKNHLIVSIFGGIITVILASLALKLSFKNNNPVKEDIKNSIKLFLMSIVIITAIFDINYIIQKKKYILNNCEMVKAKVISTSSKKALFSRTKEYYITLEFSIKNGKKIKKQILFDGKLPFEYYEKLQDFIYVCYDKNNPNTVIIPKRKFIVEKTGNNKRFIKYSDLKELLFSRNSTILSKLSKINKDWQEIVPEREWVNHRLNSKITKGANDTLQYFAVNSLITSILKELYNKSGNTNTAFNTKGNLEYKDSLLQVYSVVDFQDVKNIKLSLKIFKNK